MKYFCVLFSIIFLLNIYTTAQNKTSAQTNWPQPVFEHITTADGLPENSVRCILQDHLGYLWFGTQSGLVKYDGYNMKVYKPDRDDSQSISSGQIIKIYEDHTGTLWVGTLIGLNKFDRNNETFKRYIYNTDGSTNVTSKSVRTIYEDKEGRLFIGTNNSLELFDRLTGSFKRIYSSPTLVRALFEDTLTGNLYVGIKNKIMIFDPEKETLKMNAEFKMNSELGNINSFFQAADGIIWIAHSKGLAKFNSLLNTIKYYQPKPSLQYTKENDIGPLVEDERGFIWGGGFWSNECNQGLVCFDPENEQFKMYKSDTNVQYSLSGNFVNSIYKDQSGIIWVGTWLAGLNKWDPKKQKFKRYTYDPANPKRDNFNTVRSISEDPSGVIWFTTDDGLYSFNRSTNKFNHYKFDPGNNGTRGLYIEDPNTIWFGADVRGLGKFNPSKGTFKFYSNDPYDSTTISNNTITYILPDGKDILWLGTNGGLNKFDKSSGKFIRYVHDPKNKKSISSNGILQILKDRKGTLWIGINIGGLNKFNSADGTFKSFFLTKGSSISTVLLIYEDIKGNFWIGTYDSGLHLFDRKKEISVYNITEKDGLANNQVESILEDDSGNLWIGTDNGLSKFNPQTHRIKNYLISENFNGNRFWTNSACRTSTGEMLFGSRDGFIMFNPNSIKDDPTAPQVVISNVSLFSQPEKQLKINGFIPDLDELDLSYNENDLRIDYVGLQFADPSKNRYKHKLEGFDTEWVDAGTQRNATYTNLDAGEYVFKVTACNVDGVWNEKGASLKIIIPPPFWATWWAYGFYIIVLGSILYGIRKYEMNRQLWKHRMELETVEAVKYKEINRMKSHFFANISHEFRTPLTLILGPSENILTEAPSENTVKQAGAIKRNANRLLLLISQLLDLSKLEAGKLELKASRANIVSFIKGFTMSFESLAEGKDITLKVSAEKEQIELYFDKEKMIKIMSNLLSNACKFTQEGGYITVTISEKNIDSVYIKVGNNGTGVAKEKLSKLFDRFYQVDDSNTREHEGTGIGLALVKELVELHQGTVSVDSEPGDPNKAGTGWTEFIIELPLGRKHLRDYEIIEDEVSTDEIIMSYVESGVRKLNEFDILDSSRQQDEQASSVSDLTSQNNSEVDEDRTLILVVEDNAEVREFIKDSLGNAFQIEEAANGEQGVRKAEQIIPDLIISDIMMPKMDGNELARILKNDERTSHIPIILLTAKSEQQSRLEGLETGADDYLTKPFDTKELQIRINNLINIRRKLQEKYSSVDYVPSKNKKETENLSRLVEGKAEKLTNLEEQFMSKVLEVIENHMSEEDFSIEQFGKEAGMSRMQLHRKLKALTGKSASNYLRSVRLNKAKKMIEEKTGSISEIAYSVGFSSPQYFTRSFKEEFGYPPSEL